MRLSRILPVSALILFGAGALSAQSTDTAAGGDIDQIWRYAGTWHMQTESVDSPYSKAGKQTATLQNDCWRSAAYVACRQIVDGDSKILLVFTCGLPDHHCTSYQIPADGSPASNGTMHIDGNAWIFPWKIADKDGKTTYFRVVNVWSTPATIEYSQEYSTDQVHWTKTATGHEVKAGSK